MSYNGSGTFTINSTGQPVVAGTVITATAFNALTADLATGLTTAITKDGQTTTTARITFAQGVTSSLVTDSSSTSTGSIITAGGAGIAKNLYVGGIASFSAQPIFTSLTASSAVATDASKGLVSVTNTGTGNNVLATSPTLVTPALGTPASGVMTNVTGINYDGYKNRIINGAMVIDQRNAGASVTPASGAFTLDRWNVTTVGGTSKFSVQQNAGAITPPAGFTNYLGITSLSAYSITAGDIQLITQAIEGFNVADLGWGAAGAATVTLSFWVRSSLTGTFGGSLRNGDNNRSYPFSYSIPAANTWTQISVTVAGDTSGTWYKNSSAGMYVSWGLGVGSTYSGTANAWGGALYGAPTGSVSVVGTNGATFYITGVQLEKGSTATSFDYRPYGTELALCQRYYYKVKAEGIASTFAVGFCQSTTAAVGMTTFPTTMRIAPSALEQSGTAGDYRVFIGAGTTCSAVPVIAAGTGSPFSISTTFTVASGLTANSGAYLQALNSSAYLGWSAEL